MVRIVYSSAPSGRLGRLAEVVCDKLSFGEARVCSTYVIDEASGRRAEVVCDKMNFREARGGSRREGVIRYYSHCFSHIM